MFIWSEVGQSRGWISMREQIITDWVYSSMMDLQESDDVLMQGARSVRMFWVSALTQVQAEFQAVFFPSAPWNWCISCFQKLLLLRKKLYLNYQEKVDENLVNINMYKSGQWLRENFKSNHIKILIATFTCFAINTYPQINFE